MINSKETGDFRPTVINGKQYDNYDRKFPNYVGFLKLSAQPAKNVRASAMAHYSVQDVPYYYSGWGLTNEANLNNKPIRFNYGATVSWTAQQQHHPRPSRRRHVLQVDREYHRRGQSRRARATMTNSPATAGATVAESSIRTSPRPTSP
ncbi:MAG: hypothetical protein MZV63_58965 [Marinilabiliales bacterium]|nr:hypothetical protein [Marinilabiliales bacterium]